MAAGQLPRHDFAPAWLKLPNHENSAWKQGTGDRVYYPLSVSDRTVSHHHRSSYGSRNGIGYDDYIGASNVPQYHQYGWQRFPSSDYHDYDITYNGTQLRSSARQGPVGPRSHGQVNGSYADPYLGFPGRRPVAVNGSGSSHTSSKKPQRPKEGKSGNGSTDVVGKKSVSSTKTATDSSSSTLDEEFPSLNGEANVVENGKTLSSSSSTKVPSVWSSPSRQLKNASRSLNSSGSHRSLVLKTGNSKRLVGQSSNELLKPNNSTAMDGKKEPFSSTTGEELNVCLVTHPTIIGDKKSRFLRSLRQESHDSDNEQNGSLPPSPSSSPLYEHEFQKEGDAVETNGHINGRHNSIGETPSEAVLSSSFEAEERLLREMGWKGNDDDDNYEITEADVMEFEKLCHQLKMNGLMTKKFNGIVEDGPVRPASTRSLSLPGFMQDVKLPDLGEDTSSLSSDSSDDEVFGKD